MRMQTGDSYGILFDINAIKETEHALQMRELVQVIAAN
jgi:hypothetical protein